MFSEDVIIYLYDGGWRSKDTEELIEEYEFTEEEAEEICTGLEELEKRAKRC